IIMAGGMGTRLRPITYSIPKPLIPIAGRPCINYLMDSFYRAGVRDLIITTGYKFQSLISGVLESKHADQTVLFSVEREPAGTAGGVKLTRNFIDDTFIVGSGDILQDFDIAGILESHRKSGSKITIVLTEVDDPSQFGIAEVKDGAIVRFLEKPPPGKAFSNLINTGLYIIEPEILDEIPGGETYDFAKQLFPALLKKGVKMHAVIGNGSWLDTGRPHDLIEANKMMSEQYGSVGIVPGSTGKLICKTPPRAAKGVKISGPSYFGESVTIGAGSAISGSAIYNDVKIGDNVSVIDSVIMDSTKIEDGTRIERSVIMNNDTISEDCEIEDSVLSQRLTIHRGSKIFNVALHSEAADDDT
ncbi:mannose-1-phosphate guanyltransferase, partial [mine drainage metagenome]